MKFKPNKGRRSYNCGGYALNTCTWINPAIPSLDQPRGRSDVDDFRKIAPQMVKNLKVLMPNLRQIKKINESKKGEYVVAFRAAKNDFHFMVRKANGSWYDKRGRSEYINRHNTEDVLGKNWYHRYNGKIYLFAYTP